MKYSNYSAIDQIASTNIVSQSKDIQQVFKMSVQIVTGPGSIDGMLQIEVSNDDNLNTGSDNIPNPINWSPLGVAILINAASSIQLLNQQDLCYRYIRFNYEDLSGGTATANINVQIMQLGV